MKINITNEQYDILKTIALIITPILAFCRWAADYVLERYAKVSDFKKAGHFDYTKEVQEAVNKISKGAKEVWAGKHGDLKQRQIDFGEWYEQIQRQVNRTTK